MQRNTKYNQYFNGMHRNLVYLLNFLTNLYFFFKVHKFLRECKLIFLMKKKDEKIVRFIYLFIMLDNDHLAFPIQL